MMKFNTHCHSTGSSKCGEVEPGRVAEIYASAGYDGLILSNHYTADGFKHYLVGDTPLEKARNYIGLFRRAQIRGTQLGLTVLFGIELNLSRYNRTGKTYPVYEFLIFGMTEEFLLRNPTMFEWSQEEAFERFDREDMLMIQAHPFRVRTRVADPFFEHGIEIFNGHPGHNSHNELAAGFAAAHNLIGTAGDDFHCAETFGYAGMYFPDGAVSTDKVVDALKTGVSSVFVTGKTDPAIIRK